VDQPSPADEASNADVGGYFLTPYVRGSIALSINVPWVASLHGGSRSRSYRAVCDLPPSIYGQVMNLEIETIEIQGFEIVIMARLPDLEGLAIFAKLLSVAPFPTPHGVAAFESDGVEGGQQDRVTLARG